MHKNGVLNVLVGCDDVIQVWEGMEEDQVGRSMDDVLTDADACVRPRVPVGDHLSLEDEHVGSIHDLSVVHGGCDIGNKDEVVVGQDESVAAVAIPIEQSLTSDANAHTSNANANGSGNIPHISYSKLKSISDPSQYGTLLLDPSKKELALSDEEFMEVFHIDKEAFGKLPGWKRTNLKKGALLF